jgi:broad specificity phosphatase PhoE
MSVIAVHLVRHGEVENPERVMYGRLPGFSLSERGRAHARAAAAYLADEPGAIDALISSPLERARETAEILRTDWMERRRADLSALVDERLTETGSWREGLSRAFSARQYAARVMDFGALDRSEAPSRVATRMCAAVIESIAGLGQGRRVVLVAHQSPILIARLALERGATTAGLWRAFRGLSSVIARERCALGSVTTLHFEAHPVDGPRVLRTSYWEPRQTS